MPSVTVRTFNPEFLWKQLGCRNRDFGTTSCPSQRDNDGNVDSINAIKYPRYEDGPLAWWIQMQLVFNRWSGLLSLEWKRKEKLRFPDIMKTRSAENHLRQFVSKEISLPHIHALKLVVKFVNKPQNLGSREYSSHYLVPRNHHIRHLLV